MCRKFVVLVFVLGLAISSVQAGQIYFCGRDWVTKDALHRDDPSIPILYGASAPCEGYITGVYGDDASMVTPVTVNVGQVWSYDMYLTQDMLDPVGDGATDWIGDCGAGFMSTTTNDSYNRVTGRVIYVYPANNYTLGNDFGETVFADASTGVHIDWTFTSDTEYTVDVTDIASGTPIVTWNLTNRDGQTIADIQTFRLGLWDSEQTVRIANFVPEPATIALLGLGGLALLRRKR